MIRLQNYIDGKLQDPITGSWLDNYEPARGHVYSQIPDSGADDVNVAVASEYSSPQASSLSTKYPMHQGSFAVVSRCHRI